MIILSQQQIAQIRKPIRSNHANSEHLLKVPIHIHLHSFSSLYAQTHS